MTRSKRNSMGDNDSSLPTPTSNQLLIIMMRVLKEMSSGTLYPAGFFLFLRFVCHLTYSPDGFLAEVETEAQRGLITCSRSHSLHKDRPGFELRSRGCGAGVCTIFTASLIWSSSVGSAFACVFHLISKPMESRYEHPSSSLLEDCDFLPAGPCLHISPLIAWRSSLLLGVPSL